MNRRIRIRTYGGVRGRELITPSYSIVGLWLLKLGISHPINLISDILGILIGASLAYYGFRKTTFEKRQEDWYFRPNIWIGSAVTLLFFMRLIYRIYYLATLEDLSKLQEQANGMQNIRISEEPACLFYVLTDYQATRYWHASAAEWSAAKPLRWS